MKILITGSNGFIAGNIINQILTNSAHSVFATSAHADKLPFAQNYPVYNFQLLDIADPAAINKVINAIRPQLIIHAAAIGSPDICEIDKPRCQKINVQATRALVDAASKLNIRLIYLSTDFIFDGKNGPYKEQDPPGPVNYYGFSKLTAENYITTHLTNFAIIRLCSVYGPSFSGNARGIITLTHQKLSQAQPLKVVNDQYRTPTLVSDISTAIGKIIKVNFNGIIHISGDEMTTPFQMAMATAEYFKLDKNLIIPVSSAALNETALRPSKTGFDISKAIKELNFKPTSFKEGLQRMVAQIQ